MLAKLDALKIGDALDSLSESPPPDIYDDEPQLLNGHDKDDLPKPAEPPIDWESLEGAPPARTWWIQDWLGPWPTLTSGAGGAGKTRLWQAVATSLATGRPYLEAQCKPLKVLMWMCEESKDEVWRSQVAINAHFGLDMQSLGNLCIVPRQGVDNTLMTVLYGHPVFTPLLKQLTEQVNDLKADVLVLDNLAQLFGGNANDAHQATFFVNAMAGLVRDRPFAPVMLGHIARAYGSEFAGSAAWENACRMRWYVGPTLPDQKPLEEDEEKDPDVVYLARRKANYAAKDWRMLRYQNGVLVPDQPIGQSNQLFRDDAAERILLNAMPRLLAAGLFPTDGKTANDYLPAQTIAKGYSQGYSRKELTAAMNRLMGAGKLKRDIIGKYSNRAPKYGLQIT